MVNKVHERVLRGILREDLSDFQSLLQNNEAIIKISKALRLRCLKLKMT